MKIRALRISIVMVLIILTCSCAKSVRVRRTAPAKYDVAGVKKIVLVPIKAWGTEGASYTEPIVSRIAEIVEGRSFFKDVKILPEALSKNPDESELKKVINKNKTDAALAVSVKDIDVDTSFDTRIERKTGEEDYAFRQKCYRSYGIRHERYDEDKLFCKIPIVRKRADARAVIVFLKRRTGEWEQDDISIDENYRAEGVDEVERIESDDAIMGELADRIAMQAADNITPHPVRYKTKLSTKKGCYKGNELAKRGKWREAIAAWEDVIHKDPARDGAYYNVGIAYEALEKYQMALHFYNEALSRGSDKKYSEAVQRIDRILKEQEILREQMR